MPIKVLLVSVVLTWMMVGAAFAAELTLPASAVQQIEEPDFSPPPVPGFMLRKQTQPLTLEQMQKQADEAASEVRLNTQLQHPVKKIRHHAKTKQSEK